MGRKFTPRRAGVVVLILTRAVQSVLNRDVIPTQYLPKKRCIPGKVVPHPRGFDCLKARRFRLHELGTDA